MHSPAPPIIVQCLIAVINLLSYNSQFFCLSDCKLIDTDTIEMDKRVLESKGEINRNTMIVEDYSTYLDIFYRWNRKKNKVM